MFLPTLSLEDSKEIFDTELELVLEEVDDVVKRQEEFSCIVTFQTELTKVSEW